MASASSIITDEWDWCINCGKPYPEEHHILPGQLRKFSEENGLVAPLCADCHRGYRNGVHGLNHDLDTELKALAQKKDEELHSREEWMQHVGRNYIDGV